MGADAVTDPKSNGTYYKVIVAVAADDLRKLGFPALRPGMQAEAYIQTGDRTAFDYFTKPLKDQLSRAFTER